MSAPIFQQQQAIWYAPLVEDTSGSLALTRIVLKVVYGKPALVLGELAKEFFVVATFGTLEDYDFCVRVVEPEYDVFPCIGLLVSFQYVAAESYAGSL